MAKASKVLLMLLPAIMLTAYGVGVLRSDDCYLFASTPACGCTNQLSCACYEGSCCCPLRFCANDYIVVPVQSGGYKLDGIRLVSCYRRCDCSPLFANEPCDPNNPCQVRNCTASEEKFAQPIQGSACAGGGPDPK